MEGIETVAQYAGTIGVIMFVVGLLVKGVLSSGIFSKIDQIQTYRLLSNLSIGVFVLAGLGMVMWGFGELIDRVEIPKPRGSNPFSQHVDTSQYVLVFDRVEIHMTGKINARERNARLCFQAKVGDEILSQTIDSPFGTYIRSISPPEYRSIPLNLKSKTIVKDQPNEISVGMDISEERACSPNPDRRLSGKISIPHDLLQFHQTGNIGHPLQISGATWWNFNVFYHYEKVN